MTAPIGRERLSAVLQRKGQLVAVEDAAEILQLDHPAAAKLLSRWQQQGWLTRVRRGLYAPVPLTSAKNDQVLEDPWVLVPALFSPGYVGGASAAHHWDLTEQLFRSVFVYTVRPVKRSKLTIYGTAFVAHRIPERMMFGTRPLWRGQIRIQISDVHRTIIDMLESPSAGGGIRHVADCLKVYLARPDAQPATLIEYAERIGNGAVFKRLGFLVERMDGPKSLVDACSQRLTKGVAKLDPKLPSNRLLRRWRLWLPEAWKAKAPSHD